MEVEGQKQESKQASDQTLKTDDDGRVTRTGTLMTASAHIITAVIGSGVLSLAWTTAQLGWIAGPVILLLFSFITKFACSLLADCYRYPGPHAGERNYTYISAVKAHLGGLQYKLCGVSQYANLIGTSIGYTITSAISMGAIKRSYCYHKYGHGADCHASNTMFLAIFGIMQIIFSQFPNFEKIAGLSIVATVMSFAYSIIGVGLSLARVASGGHNVKTSLTGVEVGVDVTKAEKLWNTLQAIGNIAFAYTYSPVLIEIQDTLKSSPPENQVLKRASLIGVSVTTTFYMLCGTLGYAAFGNKAPGNFLTGFGFYEPYWLIDIANLCIIVHMIGAYQVYTQPAFKLVEDWSRRKWPNSKFINKESPVTIPLIGTHSFNPFRLVWRVGYVIVGTLIAMIFPFFNSVMGLIGAISFWPLTLYFPIEMHISQAKIRRFSGRWIWLEAVSITCLLISILAAVASVEGLITAVQSYRPFSLVT